MTNPTLTISIRGEIVSAVHAPPLAAEGRGIDGRGVRFTQNTYHVRVLLGMHPCKLLYEEMIR
jgi:hypothetical protein